MSHVKRIDVAEFRREGYLQELNRQFLHPLGLALEIIIDDDGSERFGGVWDYRDDPEGIWYEGTADPEKAADVARLWSERALARMQGLGFIVEPVASTEES